MTDKNAKDMLGKLKNYFQNIYLTEINNVRSYSIDDLKKVAVELNIDAKTVQQPSEFVRNYFTKPESECLVVLGSMYLIGEIKTNLQKEIA
jgi:folylpolyglutamate synthase/dihydropteroate synthase